MDMDLDRVVCSMQSPKRLNKKLIETDLFL
jgi:hypothetical protein